VPTGVIEPMYSSTQPI